MPQTSTTTEDNSSDDASKSTTVTNPEVTDNGTAAESDNPDASKSADTTVADDDKSNTTTDDESSAKFDDDIDDWAIKRGFPKPETDEQRAAYQKSRDEQRDFTRSRQAEKAAADAKSLGKEIKGLKPKDDQEDDDLDPIEKRQNKIEAQLEEERNTRLQSEFYTDNSVTNDEHKVILDLIKEKIARPTTDEGKKRAFDTWTSPDALPDLLDLARARIASKGGDRSVIEEEAARKERERIAKESNANSPGPNARTRSDGKKTPEQERLERFSTWD